MLIPVHYEFLHLLPLLARLKKKHLKILSDGEMEWELLQTKGRKVRAVKIFILEKAKKILEKYLAGKKPDDIIFSQSPVVTNRYIKKIGKGAGTVESVTKVNYSGKKRIEVTLPKYAFLSLHSGRRTFITLLLANGMPDHEIRSMYGRASSKEINPYPGIDRQNIRAGLIQAFEGKDSIVGCGQ